MRYFFGCAHLLSFVFLVYCCSCGSISLNSQFRLCFYNRSTAGTMSATGDAYISRITDDGIAILTIDYAPVNALSEGKWIAHNRYGDFISGKFTVK